MPESKRTQPPPLQRRSVKSITVCLAAVALLVGLDLYSKHAVEQSLSRTPPWDPPKVCEVGQDGHIIGPQRMATAPHVIIPGYLELHYAENCGAAFGLMRNQPEWLRRSVFVVAAIVACLALLWMYAQGKGQRLFAISVPLIVSGAIGNLVDRIRYGYVVDFIRFHWQGEWDYPTFNIADCGITVGVVLLIIDGFLEGRQSKSERTSAARAGAAPEPAPEK